MKPREIAEKTLSEYVSDSDVRWRGKKSEVVTAMLDFAAYRVGQALTIDCVIKCQHTGDTKHWEETKKLRCLKCKEAF